MNYEERVKEVGSEVKKLHEDGVITDSEYDYLSFVFQRIYKRLINKEGT